ncbi:hypothetical protein SY89_03519 [Halolamina pelagica]|uniref:Uncharacterized protein n=1 Tax=Halolamina pelagica TaxID=699431 RepID=A0A0P7G7R8_9EURY|nr:hypothetical protein [Halolamina pelagica]KPN29285.1 hypothetical protein SY89_03519 [Halolamina pelagica]
MPDGPLEDAPLLVSMTVTELFLAATGRNERLADFATVVAEAADGIELFVEPTEAYMSSTQAAVGYASSFGLPIRTIHTPRWGFTSRGSTGTGTSSGTQGGPPQRTGRHAAADQSYPGQPEINRVPKMEPAVATTHPPRFPTDAETRLAEARRDLVETFRATIEHIRSDRFLEAPLDLPTIAVENVCPRPGFDYLLTSPADIDQLRAVAASQGGVSSRLPVTLATQRRRRRCWRRWRRQPTSISMALATPVLTPSSIGSRGTSRPPH